MSTKYTTYPALESSVREALRALPTHPAKPVQGRGNERHLFSLDLTNRTARELWDAVPKNHWYQRDYGGVRRYASPEAHAIVRPVILEIRAMIKARRKPEPAYAPRLPLPAVQRNREAAIVVNLANIAASSLTEAEQAEIVELLNGAHHPVSGRGLELKNKSGLTWGQLQA